jgi:hypothetical protein
MRPSWNFISTMCPIQDTLLSYGFYTASQIVEGTDKGVLA